MQLKREVINAFWALMPRATTVDIGGVRYRVPLRRGFDRRVLHQAREPWLDRLLREHCADSASVLLDVGANCGQTLLKAKAINPGLRYVGCEPNPDCAGYLHELIALNQLSDCQVYPCGLGDRRRVAELYVAAPGDPSATIIANFRGSATGKQAIRVLIERGDDLMTTAALTRLDLIKLDVEGAEAEAITGLFQTISDFRPTLVCEVLSSHAPDHPTHELRARSKIAIAEILSPLGYGFYAVDGERLTPVTAISDNYRNYVFRPNL